MALLREQIQKEAINQSTPQALTMINANRPVPSLQNAAISASKDA
jgi:hypothetical protein